MPSLAPDQETTMAQTASKIGWKVVGIGAGTAAAMLTKKAMTAAWRGAKHADPPANPAAPSTSWPEGLAWAVSTGVALGVARLVAQRGAAAGWQKATGSLPPGLEKVA
ncbi:MAG TPA: DUF4235 domain-containing protein [Mycobacteriales bacterium]|nr:DUF4235 domain-containing protein [Mycobacteriales bacterium]